MSIQATSALLKIKKRVQRILECVCRPVSRLSFAMSHTIQTDSRADRSFLFTLQQPIQQGYEITRTSYFPRSGPTSAQQKLHTFLLDLGRHCPIHGESTRFRIEAYYFQHRYFSTCPRCRQQKPCAMAPMLTRRAKILCMPLWQCRCKIAEAFLLSSSWRGSPPRYFVICRHTRSTTLRADVEKSSARQTTISKPKTFQLRSSC
mmetsp:Transcript_16110/g.31925  ORF Transcript_16110/g.31925 Transcript_16110/m.31925 type:complete len:204 (-) Transcript_16110:189-800(-)